MTEKQNNRIGIGLVVAYTVTVFIVSLIRNTTMIDDTFQGFDIENAMYDFWAWFMPTWFVITIYLFGKTNKNENKKPQQVMHEWTMVDAILLFIAMMVAIIWVVIGFGGVLRIMGLV